MKMKKKRISGLCGSDRDFETRESKWNVSFKKVKHASGLIKIWIVASYQPGGEERGRGEGKKVTDESANPCAGKGKSSSIARAREKDNIVEISILQGCE